MDCVDSAWATQEEKRACLAAVEAWLLNGGTTAARGLVGNAGLLSWLAVVGPRIEGDGKGGGGRGATLKFLDVAAEAVEKARMLEAEAEANNHEEGKFALIDVEIQRLIDVVMAVDGGEKVKSLKRKVIKRLEGGDGAEDDEDAKKMKQA